MRFIIGTLAAIGMLATFIAPASANCYLHCSPDGYGGSTCHWNCY